MAGGSAKACVRCHKKKIRCPGVPDCRNCIQARVGCEPYIRPRKADSIQALKEAQRRVHWLEDEVSKALGGVDCRSCETGTPLRSEVPENLSSREQPGSAPIPSGHAPGSSAACSASILIPPADGVDSANVDNAPEISLLALNATGELRYLGPSSGALFANYATALVRSCSSSGPDQHLWRRPWSPRSDRAGEMGVGLGNDSQPLTCEEIQLLLQSYEMWVHPLYPLLNLATLHSLVTRCGRHQEERARALEGAMWSQPNDEMAIFYLVMALGAMNRANTEKQLGSRATSSASPISAARLYASALRCFYLTAETLKPSILFIQIMLLICIYSSRGPIGSSQWQLAGLAMRTAVEIGLHYAPQAWQVSNKEIDKRSRVFWTAYAIEITLAYNLGRPPSIGDQHITARLPGDLGDAALGVRHIKHRQIQSQIVSQVYYGTSRGDGRSLEEQQKVISNLQSDLDAWMASISTPNAAEGTTAYPCKYWERLYHGTTFVLHRASSLCPRPSKESQEWCIRNAGAYIDDMAEVLRDSNVPLSWMLIQGVLFAGLTMLITARTSLSRMGSRAGLPLMLVELPAWSRKCSICLAIMSERWGQDFLSKLETQFEMLVNDTLSVICNELGSQNATTSSTSEEANHHAAGVRDVPAVPLSAADGLMVSQGPDMLLGDHSMNDVAAFGDFGAMGNWNEFDLFHEFLGVDGGQSFWNMFAAPLNGRGNTPPMPI